MALSLFPRFGSFFDDFDAFGSSFGPAVHVRESAEGMNLELEVPRYRQDELSLEIRGQHLIITGARRTADRHVEYGQFLFGDAPMSHFQRSVYVPPAFDLSKATHVLDHGVLSISIPRAPLPPPPPPPQALPISGAAPSASTTVAAPVKDKHGLTVSATSSPQEYNAVANMKWPPKIKVDDAEDAITYTASMPATVTKDHIDLSLEGRYLHLGVHHRRNVVKRDDAGNVVYNQDQSVSYSTNLLVPEGTAAGDISTSYADGQLAIKVTKHPNPSQQVPVTKK